MIENRLVRTAVRVAKGLLGSLLGAVLGVTNANATSTANATVAQAIAPDLVCELSYASETQLIRQGVSADPYAAKSTVVGGRFGFKAVVLGRPDHINNITLSVYDLSVEGAPVLVQQTRYQSPFNLHPAVPALTGWGHVYSSVYGREMRYGCALQSTAKMELPK